MNTPRHTPTPAAAAIRVHPGSSVVELRISRERRAFTLIELLVVIAVIAVIAALILPVGASIRNKATLKKAQTELEQIAFAIDAYKEKLGYYPPENPISATTNTLYFELLGSKLVNNGAEYESLDGTARIANTDDAFADAFGSVAGKPVVRSIANVTRDVNADDASRARSFLTQLRPAQSFELVPKIRLLACSVLWRPDNSANPWHYRSASATNNTDGYDLWVNILVGGKTNRISNWSKQPQIVNDLF